MKLREDILAAELTKAEQEREAHFRNITTYSVEKDVQEALYENLVTDFLQQYEAVNENFKLSFSQLRGRRGQVESVIMQLRNSIKESQSAIRELEQNIGVLKHELQKARQRTQKVSEIFGKLSRKENNKTAAIQESDITDSISVNSLRGR